MDKTKKSYLAIFFIALIVSGIKPHDYFTWFLEVVPALIALIILATTYRKFQFSKFIYGLILFHSIVLMIGGHWTYAEVPLGYAVGYVYVPYRIDISSYDYEPFSKFLENLN
jgi:putative membrane protein